MVIIVVLTCSFRTESKLKEHEDICKTHDYCYIKMPKKDKNVLMYNHAENASKLLYVIYAHTESLLQETDTCHNIQKSYQ